jgi:hypothetical protein
MLPGGADDGAGMDALKAVVLTLEGVLQTFGFRVGVEQPAYVTLERRGAVELREYPPRLVAETLVSGETEASARNAGFRRVAGYIFGDNRRAEAVAMTAPVVQARGEPVAMTAPVVQASAADGGWRIQFVMPSRYRTVEDLPAPNDPAVRIVSEPARRYAVRRFTGSRAPTAVATQADALLRDAAAAGWTIRGQPVAWFYDPPWTIPFVRRNEVAAPVE